MLDIIGHDWRLVQAHFKVIWSSKNNSWEQLKDIQEYYPRMTANYIVKNNVSWYKHGREPVLQW